MNQYCRQEEMAWQSTGIELNAGKVFFTYNDIKNMHRQNHGTTYISTVFFSNSNRLFPAGVTINILNLDCICMTEYGQF